MDASSLKSPSGCGIESSATARSTKKVTEIGLKLSHVTLMRRLETIEEKTPTKVDVNDAVDLLEALLPKRQDVDRVVIVDELDEAKDPVFRGDIAFFIKQLGDSQARLQFIFAGIAGKQRLRASSSPRICATVYGHDTIGCDLPLNVLKDIIVEGFRQIKMTVKDTMAFRIAYISDAASRTSHTSSA